VTLAELREEDAPPAIAALYAALREASGVALVNLIWRHLATLEGALPWAWATVAPAFRAGYVAGGRDRLAAALALPPLPAAPRPGWLDQATLGTVRDILATYNRGNLTNLVVLTALRRTLEGAPPTASQALSAPRGAMLPAVPPLPRLAALPPATQALVAGLAARHEAGIVPSLWLHLAHWPPLLAALPEWLGPLLDPDALRAARLSAIALAEREADALRPHLAPPGEAPERAAMLAALTRFTTLLIPDMVPVGLALERVLPR
jgi:hypothetical protein